VGHGYGMGDYIKAIPLMFYPICAIVICFLLAINKFPKIGRLKKAYERTEQGGPLLETSVKTQTKQNEEIEPSSPLNFLIPMVALVAGMVLFDQNIAIGMMLALVVMLILYAAQGRMKIKEIFDTFTEGASTMMPLLITIYLTFIMEMSVEEMGFMDCLTGLISRAFPAWSIPVIAFVFVAVITFFAASFWSLIVISFPIFLPMAVAMGVNPSLVIGAVMSGVALGSQACLYSDAIFMVAAGTEVPNDVQFRTVLPYVLIGAACAAILFCLAGLFL
jgi:Na+/H+ antiporter NhaC